MNDEVHDFLKCNLSARVVAASMLLNLLTKGA